MIFVCKIELGKCGIPVAGSFPEGSFQGEWAGNWDGEDVELLPGFKYSRPGSFP